MNLKELYEKNINIMGFLRDKNQVENNSSEIILMSYDMQAGSYTSDFDQNIMCNDIYCNGERLALPLREVYEKAADFVSQKINDLKFDKQKISILDAGIGEATSFANIVPKISHQIDKIFGFDISLSRIRQAKKFCMRYNINSNLFCADMKFIPLPDNSVDLIMTYHALEPNGGNEITLLKELYRVTSKYLVLCEPSNELGNEETRQHIQTYRYITDLHKHAVSLGWKVVCHELVPATSYVNQASVLILEKEHTEEINSAEFACPACKNKLVFHNDNYFCQECMVVYPVLNKIPDLNVSHGILFSQYLED